MSVIPSCEKKQRATAAEATPLQESKTETAELRMLLEGLPEKQRIPLVLHYLEGFSLEEIARTEHMPLGTVKYRLHQARKMLWVEWDGEEGTLR